MNAAASPAQQRAIDLASRLAARGARSSLATPQASDAIEREPGGEERRLAVLTEAFRIAIREGALKLSPDHVARASAAIAQEAEPAAAPPVPEIPAAPIAGVQDDAAPGAAAWVALRPKTAWHEADLADAEPRHAAPSRPGEAASQPSAAWEMLKPAVSYAPQAGYAPVEGPWDENLGAHAWTPQDGYGSEHLQDGVGADGHEEGEPEEWARVVSTGWHLEQPRRAGAAEMPEPPPDGAIPQDRAGRGGDALASGPGARLSPPGAAPGFRPQAHHFALAALIAVLALGLPLLWGSGDEEPAVGSSPSDLSASVPSSLAAADDDDAALPARPEPPEMVLPPPTDDADAAPAPMAAPTAAPTDAPAAAPEQLAVRHAAEASPPALPAAPPPPAVVTFVAPPPPATASPAPAPSAPPAAVAEAASPRSSAPVGALTGGLPVQLPPRVVVEYAPGGQEQRAKADQVAETLRDKGVVVVAISAGDAGRPMSVDYAFTQDRRGAEQVASVLGRPWQAREMPVVANEKPPEPGTVRLTLP